MIARAASRALREVFDAANRQHRNDEKERDKTHAFLVREISDRPALAALHLSRHRLRSPVEKMCADNKKEHHVISPPCDLPQRRRGTEKTDSKIKSQDERVLL